MDASSKPAETLTPYQLEKAKREPREVWCGQVHDSIAEAIVHAERNLGMFRQRALPYWGRTKYTGSTVVGWQINDAKRYRLDFTPNFAKENAAAAGWSGTSELKGSEGVHVNEENFHDPKARGVSRICHPTRGSVRWAETYWGKWTKQFGKPE